MGARTDTRARMIDAAKAGFRANGMVATGFTEVLEASGAARGAIYHHFPGGKEELAAAVVTSTGDNIEAAIRALFASSPSPAQALATAVELVATAVEERDGFGCAIAPAVLEASGSTAVLQAADDAFARWQAAIVDGLGAGADGADLAALVVAAIEGALVLSRAAGSNEPVRRVGRALAAVLQHPAG
jgi:TetR/AcrR family transcriptional repressor of lmrAB and yxaGH operons